MRRTGQIDVTGAMYQRLDQRPRDDCRPIAIELQGNCHYIGEDSQDCYGPFQHLDDMHLDEFNLSEMEVIGNSYENPELLKAGDV